MGWEGQGLCRALSITLETSEVLAVVGFIEKYIGYSMSKCWLFFFYFFFFLNNKILTGFASFVVLLLLKVSKRSVTLPEAKTLIDSLWGKKDLKAIPISISLFFSNYYFYFNLCFFYVHEVLSRTFNF